MVHLTGFYSPLPCDGVHGGCTSFVTVEAPFEARTDFPGSNAVPEPIRDGRGRRRQASPSCLAAGPLQSLAQEIYPLLSSQAVGPAKRCDSLSAGRQIGESGPICQKRFLSNEK